MQQAHKCMECGEPATWMRATQFAGNHPYCEHHAKFENDFQISDSYSFWYKIQTPDEIGTLEGQREFDMKRNYHYTNTSNPIDFPKTTPDPKPELGEAALASNIAFCLAMADKHQKLADKALAEAKQWQQKYQEFIK